MPDQQDPKQWAKIFESERFGQILATKRTEEESEAPSIQFEANINHLDNRFGFASAEMIFKFGADEQRDIAFDGLNAATAEDAISAGVDSFITS